MGKLILNILKKQKVQRDFNDIGDDPSDNYRGRPISGCNVRNDDYVIVTNQTTGRPEKLSNRNKKESK